MNEIKNIVFPSRSRYQIEKFVIGQHDTLEMQFKQIVIEIKELENSLDIAIAEKEIEIAKIEKLEEEKDKISLLEANKKRLEIKRLDDAIASTKIELGYFYKILNDVPTFSAKEVEDNQKEYWEKRLARQAETDMLQSTKGISAGNISSLLQAGMISLSREEIEVQKGAELD